MSRSHRGSEPPPSLTRVGAARLGRMARKELRETLRDRRTVITLVLMPILVYPLLCISFYKLFLTSSQQFNAKSITIGVDTEADSDRLDAYLSRGNQLLSDQAVRTVDGRTPSSPFAQAVGNQAVGKGAAAPAPTVQVQWFPEGGLESHVSNLDVQLAVRMLSDAAETDRPGMPRPLRCQLIYRPASRASLETLQFVEDRLRAVNRAALEARMARWGRRLVLPAQFQRRPIAVVNQTSFSLATLVPLVLILMTITGAVYPAIDLTAGERERGTMESLIAAPIPRLALLVAKYIAVVTVAVLTAMINLLAMTATVTTSGLGSYLFPSGVSLTLVTEIFGLMILFAAFFSAILLAITSFARSFKEAQAYLIPVMLLAISPGLMSLMPGLVLNPLLGLTPLVNIVLLSRDLLEGHANFGLGLLVIGATLGYACVALAIAARIFGNDALLAASRGSWSDLFRWPTKPSRTPTLPATVGCLAVMFPVYFLLANGTRLLSDNITEQLVLNSLVTVLVFGGCPLLFALVQRVRLISGFRLGRPGAVAVAGGFVLGLSLWPFAHEIFLIGAWCGLASLDGNQLETAQKLVERFTEISPVLLVMTLAVVPATLEEFFFRGFLLSGLCTRLSARGALVASSLLFGLFHVLTPSVLTPERFLPSTFLGLVLAWLCLRSGSLWPGIVLHASHNSLLLLLGRWQEELKSWGWDVENQRHLPGTWLTAALIVSAAGAGLVFLSARARRQRAPRS